ncbi:MAG: hypothetical protein ACQERU_10255, partial [Bacteroidota bacterium]
RPIQRKTFLLFSKSAFGDFFTSIALLFLFLLISLNQPQIEGLKDKKLLAFTNQISSYFNC